MLNNLTFVTGNENKLREARQITGLELKGLAVNGLHEIQTVSVEEAVAHKAKEAYDKLRTAVMVEDSGLVFNAWNGMPGALVKWFEETVGNDGLLKMLEGYEDRTATAQCFVAVYDGIHLLIAKGEVHGTVAHDQQGENGFGWDRIFIPAGRQITYAQMTADEKNSDSHRKRAYEELLKLLPKLP